VLGDEVHVIGRAYKAHSFPSGHATTAFAVAGLLTLGIASRAWVAAIIALATLVALSRAVVGVHWPLDILAGAFGGWLAAVFAVRLAERTRTSGRAPSSNGRSRSPSRPVPWPWCWAIRRVSAGPALRARDRHLLPGSRGG